MAKSENLFEISDTEDIANLPDDAWKVRPCEWYRDEYKDCKSVRARFHQYFVFGESLDCTQWKNDYEQCKLFRHKKDLKSLGNVIESENKRHQQRKNTVNENNIWEYRYAPPQNWNSPMPEWMIEKKKASLLVETQNLLNEEEDSESDVDDLNCVLEDSSDGDFYSSDGEKALLVPVGDNKKPEKDGFVLVEFTAKQKIIYVGKVNNINASNEYEITFMHHSVKFSGNFVFPPVPDVGTVC